MNPRSIVDILDRFLVEGYSKDIFLAVQPHILKIEGDQIKLSPAFRMEMITNGGVTISEYIDLLENNQYSAVFDDGSILYIECIFSDGKLDAHRYFFIPCPFVETTIASKPGHCSLADWLRASLVQNGVDVFSSRGTFRFDFARKPVLGAADPHPKSHLTFASDWCRMPVRGPVQITSFMNFLFDNFFRDYQPVWRSFASYMQLDETEVTITEEEVGLHHLNWETQV